MSKLFWVLIALALLVLAILTYVAMSYYYSGFGGRIEPITPGNEDIERMQKCASSDDCVIVPEWGCCKCPTAINKEYEHKWSKLSERFDAYCSTRKVICKPCFGPSGVECIDHVCKLNNLGLE